MQPCRRSHACIPSCSLGALCSLRRRPNGPLVCRSWRDTADMYAVQLWGSIDLHLIRRGIRDQRLVDLWLRLKKASVISWLSKRTIGLIANWLHKLSTGQRASADASHAWCTYITHPASAFVKHKPEIGSSLFVLQGADRLRCRRAGGCAQAGSPQPRRLRRLRRRDGCSVSQPAVPAPAAQLGGTGHGQHVAAGGAAAGCGRGRTGADESGGLALTSLRLDSRVDGKLTRAAPPSCWRHCRRCSA